MTEFNPEELTRERSLFAIFLQCKNIWPSRFNILSSLGVVSTLVIYCIYGGHTSHDLASHVRALADTGLGFAANLLGFLLAGFAIFATVTEKSLLLEMAKHTHQGSGLSYLKYSFFSFMWVFILFLSFGVFCLLILLLGKSGGPVSTLLNTVPVGRSGFKYFFASSAFVFLGAWFFFLMMTLKSFIFNIYHIVMTGIRWEAEKPKK